MIGWLWRRLVHVPETVTECRHCGTTVGENVTVCPTCGRDEIALYLID